MILTNVCNKCNTGFCPGGYNKYGAISFKYKLYCE